MSDCRGHLLFSQVENRNHTKTVLAEIPNRIGPDGILLIYFINAYGSWQYAIVLETANHSWTIKTIEPQIRLESKLKKIQSPDLNFKKENQTNRKTGLQPGFAQIKKEFATG